MSQKLSISIGSRNLLAFIAILLFLLWSIKIHQYYFDIEVADVVGMLLLSFTSFIVGRKYIKGSNQLMMLVLAIGLAIGLYPTASLLIQYVPYSWYVIYFSLFVFVSCISALQTIQWVSAGLLFTCIVWVLPYDFSDSQQYFHEKLVNEVETRKGAIHVTKWKNDLWYYYNKSLVFSTVDGHMYSEATTHPALSLVPEEAKVLVIGGDHGLIEQQLSKYDDLMVEIIPYDNEYAGFFAAKPVPKKDLSVFHQLNQQEKELDLIIVDLPMATDYSTNQYYTKEFYQLCQEKLSKQGMMVISAGDPVIDTKHVAILESTIDHVFPYQISYEIHVPTIGQWQWILASDFLIQKNEMHAPSVATRWLDAEAMEHLRASMRESKKDLSVPVNTIQNPVLLTTQ